MIFMVAVLYASVCTTTCAFGICPKQAHRTSGHDCDQMPSHHSHQSGHKSPDIPDCSQHGHPGVFLAKSSEITKVQFSVKEGPNASVPANGVSNLTANTAFAGGSDLAPPLTRSLSLYQQNSVLRI